MPLSSKNLDQFKEISIEDSLKNDSGDNERASILDSSPDFVKPAKISVEILGQIEKVRTRLDNLKYDYVTAISEFSFDQLDHQMIDITHDETLLMTMLELCESRSVEKYLKKYLLKFNGLTNFSANAMIENGYSVMVISNPELFGIELNMDLVNKIIDSGFGVVLLWNEKKFRHLGQEFKALIEDLEIDFED